MKRETARLGILGGMGPQATLAFYQRILDKTPAKRDQDHLPALIWSDTQIPDRTAAILSGEIERTYAALLAGAELLVRGGCTTLAMPCNTAHFFAPRLQAELGVPLLNMVELAVAALRARGIRRVGILATDGTVQTAVYQKECAAQGLMSAVPGPRGQRAVMDIIYGEIKVGRVGTPGRLDGPLEELRSQGCDGIVVGCTELSVYTRAHGLPADCTDAMDVLADACMLACGYAPE